jgi:formylmethanofuran dehydrogenase subunit E|tara:strand:+ start:16564 stop:16896 length:333 start_codon:yes stop_codon:yes gene_type:complete
MSRSRRSTGKLTVKQLQGEINEVKREFSSFANAAATDIMKLNHIIYGLLDEAGKISRIECVNCKEEAIRPNIEGLENSDICPNCGRNLFNKEQTTLDDMHRAIQKIGEEE